MPRAGSSTHEGRATLHVRRTAGEVVLALLNGPKTAHELEDELGVEVRTIKRAIIEIELWGDVLDVTRPGRHGHKGSRPYVYALACGWDACVRSVADAVSAREEMAASLALALEGAA